MLGRHDQKNAVTLHSVFTDGSFIISIYYKLGPDEKELLEIIEGIDYSAHISISPLVERADRFNCDAGRLPHSLNLLMDIDGFLRYSDRVFADFAMKQVTEVVISQASVVRITSLEPSGIDVDLLLKDSTGVVSQSNAVGGAEGLLKELKPGNYVLEVSFVNSFVEDTRHKFCETIILEIGISPIEAVKSLVKHYGLDDCEDNTQEIIDIFRGVKSTLETTNVNIFPSNNYFTLPLKSLAIGEEVIFRTAFEVPQLVYGYFEVHSDFILGDLTIELEKKTGKSKSEQIQGTEDALEIGEHGRRSFHGELSIGEYFFVVRTGPTAKLVQDASGSDLYYHDDNDYKVLPKCVPLHFRMNLLKVSEKSLKKWNCRGADIRFLPKTLNTIDKLGVKNTPQSYLPSSVYFSTSVLAPDSHKNVTDFLNFYMESESIIRVLVESEESPMKISLTQGVNIIGQDGSLSARTPFIYSFSTTLNQHNSYKLEIEHYPPSEKCYVYSILIEIIPKSRMATSEICVEKIPDQNIITERLLEYVDLFEFVTEDGTSTTEIEQFFQYFQEPLYKIEIPLEVTTESALVTGHLLTSFVKSGLVIEIESEGTIIEWGRYKAPHRYELDPIPLSIGKYSIILKEISKSALNLCITYTASILLEDVGFWDDISSMVKKTETCSYSDQPSSLNVVGQLASGSLQWHKTLLLDVIFGQSFLEFNVNEESVVSLFIMPQTNIQFRIEVTLVADGEIVLTGSNNVVGKILTGQYLIEILYDSDFGLPNSRLCPGFEVDLSIMPVSDYEIFQQQYSCKNSQNLPNSLMESSAHYLQFGPISKSFSIFSIENSELDFSISFQSILSGYLRMELLDAGGRNIEKSMGGVNWGMLKAAVPAGNYQLKIVSEKTLENNCWDLAITFSQQKSEVCIGGLLPSSTADLESIPYGGPQSFDGPISFYGVFKVSDSKEIIKLYAKKTGIARILLISNPAFRTEVAVYQHDIFDLPIAYSKNRSRFSSFIFELAAQNEPYYLVLSHILENPEACLLYELKITVMTKDSLGSYIECKVNSHENLLPPLQIEFSDSKSVGSDTYAIFDKWIIGDDFPEGVTSKGKKDSRFTYEISLKVLKKGVVSLEANYDFLTNDLTLDLKQGKETLISSDWEIFSEDQMTSSIEEIQLDPGTYTIVLKQGVASNHLVQRYPEVASCFPFSFYIEFMEKKETTKNYMLSVNPSQVSQQNTLQNLLIFIKFEHPLEETTETDTMFYLKSSESLVFPDEVSVNSNAASKIKLKFSPSSLEPNSCYELVLASKNIISDGLTHQYCTLSCFCNPKAKAECVDNSCVCSDPFTGPNCFECIEGYIIENNSCSLITDTSPKILSASFNIQSPVKRNQQLRLYVDFSSAPYTKTGEKITRMNSEAIQSAFLLKSSEFILKPFTIFPLVKGEIKWVLRYDSEEVEYGKKYRLEIQGGLLFASSGQEFENNISEVSIEIDEKGQESYECSGHGVEKGIVCSCDEGYKGADCSSCEKGFRKTDNSLCEEVPEGLETDKEAYLALVSPSEMQNIIQGQSVVFEISLSTQAFTHNGYIIDSLSNSNYIQEAFVLQKTKSEKFYNPISVLCLDKKGLNWKLTFATSNLSDKMTYKLSQITGFLYTASGKAFDIPLAALPRIRIFSPISCVNGVQEQDYCICKTGYKGVTCEECSQNFYQTLQGQCIFQLPSPQKTPEKSNEVFSTFLYCIAYTLLVGIIMYIINGLRKIDHLPSDLELVERSQSEDVEIDLYK